MFVKGMLCPGCQNSFLYIEAKNRSFSFRSALNCPLCNMRLQYPDHLRKASLYIKMIVGLIFFMGWFLYALGKYGDVGLYSSLPFMFLFLYWLKKSFKLKNGLIPMVPLHEKL